MYDVKWVIDQNMSLFAEGKICERSAIANMLNAVAMSETDTIDQYTCIKQAVMSICKEDEKLCKIICNMLDGIIQDEGDHQASAQKAANICQGIKAPKPREYKEASDDDKAI